MPQPEDFVHPFAEVALSNITRDYPYAAHHLARSLADIVPAAEKNPAFANSFDWHSSVHMHYLLASLLETEEGRNSSWTAEALEILAEHLSDTNMLAEAAFLRDNPSWERPYGWAWAVELNRVLNASDVATVIWFGSTQVLAELSLISCPRGCRRSPSRFAMGCTRTRHSGCAGSSSALVCRSVMTSSMSLPVRLVDSSPRMPRGISVKSAADTTFSPPVYARRTSWPRYSPRMSWPSGYPIPAELDPESPALTPITVLDPTDGQQSHLYGLGLSVAASVMRLAAKLEAIAEKTGNNDLAAHARGMLTRVDALMTRGLKAAVSDEYMSSHWVATFAWEVLRLN